MLARESKEFSNMIIFNLNKITKNEYYLKEYNTSIDIQVKTTKININEEIIEIYYTIIDTNEEFLYVLEMSEKI